MVSCYHGRLWEQKRNGNVYVTYFITGGMTKSCNSSDY
jgi:hypothetical protein